MTRSASRSRSPSVRQERPAASRSRSRSRSVKNDRREDRSAREDDRGNDREERRSRRDDSGESNSVLVRHLNYKTSPEEIKKIFGEFGEVTDVYLPLDYQTKRPRGFGFVQFKLSEDAQAACKGLDRTDLDGNQVEVVIAKQNRKSPGTMRKFQGRERSDRDHGRSRREPSRERYSRRSRSRSAGRRYDDRRDNGRNSRDDRRRDDRY